MKPRGAEWPDLRTALEELALAWRLHRQVLHIALLPPLVQVRHLDLPPLKDPELRRVIAKGARRYFPIAVEPLVVGAERTPPVEKVAARVFASGASASVVDAVLGAAADTGWCIASMVGAVSAWVAGAVRTWPVLRRTEGKLIVASETGILAIHVRSGRPVLVRRRSARRGDGSWATSVADMVREAKGTETGRLAVIGPLQVGREIAQHDDPTAVPLEHPEPGRHLDAPEEFAAAHAALAPGPDIFPERVHLERHRLAVRQTAVCLTAAAVLLIAAAVLEYWGQARELDALRVDRGRMRGTVAAAMAGRDSAVALQQQVAFLSALESTAPRWSLAIATVAQHLPGDAYLSAFHAEGDSLVLEGVASRAAAAFESLRGAQDIVGVRATAPIRREFRDGREPLERFSFAVRLVPRPPSTGTR